MPRARTDRTLGAVLATARVARGLSLRDVERETGVRSGISPSSRRGRSTSPEMAILWDLAALYDLAFTELLVLAGYAQDGHTSGRQRQRMTVALRALGELTPAEQAEALRYMADLKARRGG